MTDTESKIKHIKVIIEHAKLSPIFKDRQFFDYICAIIDEEFQDSNYRDKLMILDRKLNDRVEKRINIIKTVVRNLCSFENEDIKKYISDSIECEMWMAFSMGRFGDVD